MSFFAGGRGGFMSGGSAADLSSGGTITGNLTVTGTLAAGASTLASATVTGAATVGTTLGVTGASTLTGDIAAGNINLASGKIVTLDAGTLASPALKFSGSNTGTGLFASTADQIQVARSGVSQSKLSGSTGIVNDITVTNSGATGVYRELRIDAESIKTNTNYTVTNTDAIVIMADDGVTQRTATLPTTPATDQIVWIKNRGTHASGLVIARNGQTIDGAAADLNLAAGACALLCFEGTGWIRLSA